MVAYLWLVANRLKNRKIQTVFSRTGERLRPVPKVASDLSK